MRILIVGNDPKEVGGVANYTRPLAHKLKELGHEIYYLFSGAYHSRYDFRGRPYLETDADRFTFECAEIINSTNLPFNYGHPELDMQSPEMNDLISQYLDRIKPDVMHIHSRFGFPASINEIASNKGIAVLNTIHVYGYLCQKRVMIDHTGKPCPGPSDLDKCAVCTGTLDYRKERVRALLRNYNKRLKLKASGLFNLVQRIKGHLKPPQDSGRKVPIQHPGAGTGTASQLATRLAARLEYCTGALNCYSDRVICVSRDVKATLMEFGVDEGRLLVQHIGSVIAEKQLSNERPLRDPIVIGNIGGVNYYKGTHILVEAIAKLRTGNFIVKIFGKYDEAYVRALMDGFPDLPIEFTGRYLPEQLPEILEQVDVMVLPSICKDTAPQTIFESFSGGVPIIASDIGGFPDFVQHDLNGLLFQAGDSCDLAGKIGFLLEHPDRLSVYRQNIPRLKTVTENAGELILLYRSLVGNKEASPDN
jgi:glycosyltransferase involved in cell wall biosynthesis